MRSNSSQPSSAHTRAAEKAVHFFSAEEVVDAVLLVGSCAQGWADEASDLDLAVVVRPSLGEAQRQALLSAWEESDARAEAGRMLQPLVRYSDLEVDLIDAEFAPKARGWTSGPDEFELELGNYVAHSVVLFDRDARVQTLHDRWLPFYSDSLREERLESVRIYCLNNLDHVPWALERGDVFHAFHRLYHAFQEFLQALFISRRTYPLAYDKWVAQQLELVGLAGLVPELQTIIGTGELDKKALGISYKKLELLLDDYAALGP